ncbi:MAG: stress protein [Thalassobius sp.]|nr:stress protein [Thalassovita sp.]
MSITLSKGEKLSLEKEAAGLKKVFMGLGWDPADSGKKKGFLGGLLGGGAGGDIDLDASVIVLDAAKKVLDTVSFSQLRSKDGSIRHAGDNLTGQGDGDDEVIHVDLSKLDSNAAYLVFTVNSFRGQTFNEVDNAVARLVDETGNTEICRFTLREHGRHTGVIMASLAKNSDGWQMTAHGVPAGGRTVRDLANDAISVL